MKGADVILGVLTIFALIVLGFFIMRALPGTPKSETPALGINLTNATSFEEYCQPKNITFAGHRLTTYKREKCMEEQETQLILCDLINQERYNIGYPEKKEGFSNYSNAKTFEGELDKDNSINVFQFKHNDTKKDMYLLAYHIGNRTQFESEMDKILDSKEDYLEFESQFENPERVYDWRNINVSLVAGGYKRAELFFYCLKPVVKYEEIEAEGGEIL